MADGATAATPYDPPEPPEPPNSPRTGRESSRWTPATAAGGDRVAAQRFRAVLGHFATGVVAITAIDPGTGGPAGLVANSFTSVSLEPPLVSFCVAHTSTTWPRLRTAARFCVNILSAAQRDACRQLAARGGEKFAGLEWTRSRGGGPVLDGALAWLECSIEAEHVAGDHVIVVARVRRLDRHHEGDPLVFYKGSYGGFASG